MGDVPRKIPVLVHEASDPLETPNNVHDGESYLALSPSIRSSSRPLITLRAMRTIARMAADNYCPCLALRYAEGLVLTIDAGILPYVAGSTSWLGLFTSSKVEAAVIEWCRDRGLVPPTHESARRALSLAREPLDDADFPIYCPYNIVASQSTLFQCNPETDAL